MKRRATSRQVGGSHYRQMAIQPEAPAKPATSGETAKAIERFEKRYSATLERLAKR